MGLLWPLWQSQGRFRGPEAVVPASELPSQEGPQVVEAVRVDSVHVSARAPHVRRRPPLIGEQPGVDQAPEDGVHDAGPLPRRLAQLRAPVWLVGCVEQCPGDGPDSVGAQETTGHDKDLSSLDRMTIKSRNIPLPAPKTTRPGCLYPIHVRPTPLTMSNTVPGK